MIKPTTLEEIQILKVTNQFSEQDLVALSTGTNLTLGLYMKSRNILGEAPHIILTNEVQELMTKVFLIFTTLERKGIISMQDLHDTAAALEKENTK